MGHYCPQRYLLIGYCLTKLLHVIVMSVVQPASSDMIGYKLFSFYTHANK